MISYVFSVRIGTTERLRFGLGNTRAYFGCENVWRDLSKKVCCNRSDELGGIWNIRLKEWLIMYIEEILPILQVDITLE